MKKHDFFSDTFLDECQKELNKLYRDIEIPEQSLTPINFNDQEREVAKLFYNRLLWLLYNGGRISKDTYIKECYILSHWDMGGPSHI